MLRNDASRCGRLPSWTVAAPLYSQRARSEKRTLRSTAADASTSPGSSASAAIPFSWPLPPITEQPPLAASHTAMTPSNEAEANRLPPEAWSTTSAVMPLLCPISVETTLPADGSIRLSRPESESEATVLPCQQQPTCMSPISGLSESTIVRAGRPLAASHSLTVLSAEAVISCLESGDHAHA